MPKYQQLTVAVLTALLLPLSAAAKPRPDYEVIVVGSGFGGSIAAYNLARAGIDALVLERGRDWRVTDPKSDKTFATLPSVLNGDGKSTWLDDTCRGSWYLTFVPEGTLPACNVTTGLFEVIGAESNPNDRSPAIRIEGVSTASASGVGGGSLVYNGVSYAPLKEAWDVAFPSSELPYMQDVWKELQKRGTFESVLRVIAPSQIPNSILNNPAYEGTRNMRDIAVASGYPLEDGTPGTLHHGTVLAPTAVDWRSVQQEIDGRRVPSAIVGETWWGNNSGAKRSLDKPDNYLGMALATGRIELRPLHTVLNIAYDESTKLYTLLVMKADLDYRELRRFTITTRNLILGAGSMGTTKLLVRARERGELPKLNEHVGTRWSTNGNTASFRFLSTGIASQGGPAGIKIVNYDNPQNPIVVENLPQRVPSFFANDPQLAPFLGALLNVGLGIPTKFGNFSYDTVTDTVVLRWPVDGGQNVYDGFVSVMNELQGGTPYLFPQATAQSFTAHPLGGMPLGLATDLDCSVKGYKHLYAVDGSIVPGAAAATNPTILIAALAQRCMDKVTKQIKNGDHGNHGGDHDDDPPHDGW